jgi:hypothetical protein
MSDNSFFGMAMAVLIGLAFAGGGGYMWMEQGERIDTFEPTEATILSSEVGVNEGDADDGPTYYPSITYEYTVDGQTYEGTNVLPGPGRTSKGNRGWAETIVENHPEGETATVYYDPDDPSTSFLLKKREKMWLAFIGIGGLVSVAAAVGMVKRVVGFVT